MRPIGPLAEREAIRGELAAEHGVECRFDEDARVRAGLRISANGNVVDGTLDGLLADRADIGSQLLHLLEPERGHERRRAVPARMLPAGAASPQAADAAPAARVEAVP